MKRIKMAYMLGMLLVQSACIMSMDGENLNFQNLDDAAQEEVRAAIQNDDYVLSADGRYLVVPLNNGSSVVVDLNRLLRANENQPAGPAQEEAKEADEKEQANAEEEDVIETDTDHPSQR